MRILLFHRAVFPQESYLTYLISSLCEDLEERHNTRTTVIMSRLSSPLPTFRGVRVVTTLATRFRGGSLLGRLVNSLSYFLNAMLLGWRGARPQVVVSIADAPSAALPAWIWCRLRRAKLVILSQEVFPQTGVLLGRFRNKLAFELLDWIGWFVLHTADAIVVPGEAVRDRLLALKKTDASKIHVIPNGVDTSAITPGHSENEFRKTHELSGKFVVMHSGYVGFAQNLETMVDAAALLKEISQIKIVIIGEGDGRESLQQRAAGLQLENVLFLPFQLRSALAESLAAADVFVISMKENMKGYIVPSRLYDVLAAGRPFVAAVEADSETAALTTRYECGLLARPGDAADLAEKLLECYYNREWVAWRGNNARTAAVEYDRKHQADKYADLFARMLPEVK